MKNLLILLTLCLGTSFFMAEAKAQSCKFELQTRNGRVIQSFRGHGYDACRDARRQCRWELDSRQRRGRNPYAQCVRVRGGGHSQPPRGQNSCSATLYNSRGSVISTFTVRSSRGYNACQGALDKCYEKQYRMTRRGNYGTYCSVDRNGRGGRDTRPPKREVSKSCTYGKFSRRGNCLATYTGYARAYSDYDAKRRACADARNRCEYTTSRGQYCREI